MVATPGHLVICWHKTPNAPEPLNFTSFCAEALQYVLQAGGEVLYHSTETHSSLRLLGSSLSSLF